MKRELKIVLLVFGVLLVFIILVMVVIYIVFKITYLDVLDDALGFAHTVLNVLYSGTAVLCVIASPT